MMNSSETKTKYASAKATNLRRRILAATCAFAIALLQCAVILTVETEKVHGASNLEVTVECKDANTSKSFSGGELSPSEDIGSTGKKGIKLRDVFGKTGISESYDKLDESDLSEDDLWCPEDGKFYKSDGSEIPNSSKSITFKMNNTYSPIEDIKLSGVPSSAKVGTLELGSKVQYTAKDDFFKDDIKKYATLKWSSSNQSVATVNQSGTVTIKKDGSFTISIEAKSGSSTFKPSASITGTTDPTTAKPTTKPTTAKKTSISKAKVSISDVTYNGKSRKPSPTVKLGKKTLKEGRDYTVSYSNNKNVGTATVTITGKGKYKGSITTTFQIKKKSSTSTRATTRSGSSYRPITRVTGSASNNGTTTGTTVPNVTYAPDRTITVKEVFIGAKVDDTQQQDPYSTDPYNTVEVDPDDGWDDGSDDWSEEDPAADLDFGPMAGSAAVAAAACGAGAVGRIRRFKGDTAAAVTAAVTEKKVGKLFKKKG